MFSRDPLRNPEILKPKTYSITRTIVRQVITFFLGLLIGLGTTYFLTWVANHHTIQFTDGSTIGFGIYGGITFVIFCISLIGGIYWQHENSASSVQVKQTWNYHALAIGSFSGLITLFGLFMTELLSVVLIVLYQVALILHLSLIVVNVQGFVLTKMAFNENDHHWLMSTEANFWACKIDVLPYRERIKAFWLMISFLGALLFLSALTWVVITTDQTPDTGASIFSCLFLPALFLLFVWGAIMAWETMHAKNFIVVKGKISKSMTPRRYRTPPTYTVHCNEQSFSTEDYLWYNIVEGSRYQLWYIPIGRNPKMIAFERIPDPQPVPKPAPIQREKRGCLPARFQSGRRGRNPKHSKLPESH